MTGEILPFPYNAFKQLTQTALLLSHWHVLSDSMTYLDAHFYSAGTWFETHQVMKYLDLNYFSVGFTMLKVSRILTHVTNVSTKVYMLTSTEISKKTKQAMCV
jgi:hypothetical protein